MNSTNSFLINQKIIDKNIASSLNSQLLQQINTSQSEDMDIESSEGNKQQDHLQNSSDQKQLELNCVKKYNKSDNEPTKSNRNEKKSKLKKVQYSIVNLNERYVPQMMPSNIKCFLLTGGIVIEMEQSNQFDINSVYAQKQISKIQKLQNGSVSIGVATRQPLKKFDHVIYILESTQNYDNYIIAKKLRDFQQPIYNINSTIERIKLSYDNEQLFQIIEERKQCFKQFQQQCIQQYLKDDEFISMAAFQIDWNMESITVSNFLLSKAIIALLGTVNEEMISLLLRNGLFQICSSQSRRKILDLSLKYYTNSQSSQIIYEDIVDFELLTLDNIKVKCNAQLQRIVYQYPRYLQFNDNTNNNINNFESISFLKYDITQDHLINIINLRQTMINKQNSNFYQNPNIDNTQDNQSIQMAQNFEYYMQSEIFLENFYQDKIEKNNKKPEFTQPEKTCKYRTIPNQNIYNH